MGFETKESLASELVTFVDNDGELYRGQTTSIIKNLVTKIARGDYDRDKAVKLFMYLAESGAKKYARVFNGSERGWHDMFPIDVRRMAAVHWRDAFEAEAKLGNYDSLLPKKYQPKPAKPSKPRTSKAKNGEYAKGAEIAQRVASNLSDAEIAHIIATEHVFVGKNTKMTPEMSRGYLNRLANIAAAREGN